MTWKAWMIAAALICSGPLYAQMEGKEDIAKQVDDQMTKYDTDKNGKVTKAEYRAVERSESEDAEDSYEWLEKWKFSLIDFLASDTDDDLEVTKAELTAYMETVTGGESEKFGKLTKKDIGVLDDEYLEPFIKWIMGKLDTDKNGKISKKEAEDAEVSGVMEYDANKDGNLDAMEIKESEVQGLAGLYDIEEGYKLKGEPSTVEKPDPNAIPDKVREVFGSMDPDKDGVISKAEMKSVSMKETDIRSKWWGVYIAFLSMDANDDLQVDIKEFYAYGMDEQNGVKHKFYPADRAEALNEIWLDLDADKDGEVTPEEWLKVFPRNDEFAGFDADSNGKLTKDEAWDGLKGSFAESFEFPDKDRDTGSTDGGTPNPDDPMWALYKKEGRSWTVKNVSKFMGVDDISYYKYEVIKVAADHCILKFTMLDKDRQPIAGIGPKESKLEFKTARGGTPDNAPVIKDLGTETIKVEAGEIECKVSEVVTEVAGAKYTTKTWSHTKYSSLTVKAVTTSGESTTTSELVEFKE